MVKRFQEAVEVVVDDASPDPDHPAPRSFRWRGRGYEVLAVLGHWREDASYWAARSLEVPQRDLWRVEARRGSGGTGPREIRASGPVPRPAPGVFELVRETGAWRLQRVWD